MVASALMLLVMAICLMFLVSIQTTENTDQLRSQANDQARQAVEQIDREVRSGNLLYDPASEPVNSAGPSCSPITVPADDCIATGYSLRVYTQANGNYRCVQWRVLNQELQTRSWNTDATLVTTWSTVADHVVNATTAGAAAPFSRDGGATFGGRLLDVNALVNEGNGSGHGVQVQASVAGRNTWYGYSPTVCSTIPAP